MTTRSLSSTLISCYQMTRFIQQFCVKENIECPFAVDEIQLNLSFHITEYLFQEDWILEPEDRQPLNFFKLGN